MSFKNFYNGLGNNKSQRFWRFFFLCSLFAGVIVYGFYGDDIKISINKTFGTQIGTSAGENK